MKSETVTPTPARDPKGSIGDTLAALAGLYNQAGAICEALAAHVGDTGLQGCVRL
jgi:hypothetical protein